MGVGTLQQHRAPACVAFRSDDAGAGRPAEEGVRRDAGITEYAMNKRKEGVMEHTEVRKAVIPVAGMGTRLLPLTKSQPKEMLPVVDKPAIQYVVEEAIDAGIESVLMVTGRGKRAIEDYFDHSVELEHELESHGKLDIG